MPSLKEIWASITSFGKRIDALEQKGAAAESKELTDLRAAFTDLNTKAESAIRETEVSLEKANKDLASAQESVSKLTGEKTELTNQLSGANKIITDCTANLQAHMATVNADYAPKGSKSAATLAELCEAEKNATNEAMAKAGVKIVTLPAAPAAAGVAVPAKAVNGKRMTLDEEIAQRNAAKAASN